MREPLNEPPNNTKSTLPKRERPLRGLYPREGVVALELPFAIVGAVVLGGLLGYLLDHWLQTKFIFTLILGGLGFAAGIREVIRRLS